MFRRIVYFGRMETRKGFEVFVEALRLLKLEQEIVFLGAEASNRYGSSDCAAQILRDVGYTVSILNQMNSLEAQAYLADHAADTLVVMPSLSDNFPYAVIETSLISGLNVICSRHGGMPEIIGFETEQLFDPSVASLREALLKWIGKSPQSQENLGQYPVEAANQRWLAFHEAVVAEARQRPRRAMLVAKVQPDGHAVDVCIPYYNHAAYLPALLQSLEQQTVSNFNVIVVDDGSTDEEARDVFAAMQKRYPQWQFLRQENRYLGATRNAAAQAGQADYLCFIDSDDLAAPQMIQRFYESIVQSGDDCLASYKILFQECDERGYQRVKPYQLYKPLGADLLTGLLLNVLGGAGIIIRRDVFEALGGYVEERDVSNEDYNLLVRLVLAKYQFDVIPEYLYHYRIVEDSMLRTNDLYPSRLLVLDEYEKVLNEIGLYGLAESFFGLYQAQSEVSSSLEQVVEQAVQSTRDTDIEGRLWGLQHQLDTNIWDLQHQLDAQTDKIEQSPSLVAMLRGMYRAFVPTRVRLGLRRLRRRDSE
ncbi:MAG: glycosyltransferase [Anaerolineae bacterium]|nr:glycosyltransferase [Anaerolineae bacterium]